MSICDFEIRNKIQQINEMNWFLCVDSDIGFSTGWEMRKDVLPYTDFTAPGVELHCLYGEGFPTFERFFIKSISISHFSHLNFTAGAHVCTHFPSHFQTKLQRRFQNNTYTRYWGR